jgi:acetyl-CoA acetyltransferase
MNTTTGFTGSARGRAPSPVHVVGCASTDFLPEHDAMLDELVFDAVNLALREAGLRKSDVGLAVLASMDVLDGRSISSGLTNAAATGYLSDSFRIEGDSGLAVISAAQAVASGDVEVAVAVGVHNPETTGTAAERTAFLEQVSNLAFEPHFDRPVGLTSNTVLALQAAQLMESAGTSLAELADLAAAEINTGSTQLRSVRIDRVTPGQVTDSPAVAWPLHELMLPAHSTGAVAVVLASPARAGRCLGRDARITGLGHATGSYTWDGQWLADPAAATRRAASQAYRHAGIVGADVLLAELTAPSPALHALLVEALHLSPGATVNASGGARSNFPGLANGCLRLLEVLDRLGDLGAGSLGVSHSLDTITGTVSQDASVLLVEAL